MRAHSSLRLGTLHGTTPELLASPWYCAWGFCMVWEAGSPTRRPLLPLNAGTAEPVRVSPPEAVAYLLELSAQAVLDGYKGQARAERGFRFLKDPQFLASSLSLKKPERIMALLMVMTVCLLVYAALEYRIRTALKEQAATFPDQKGKRIQTPPARWVFHYFVGIHVLYIPGQGLMILNLTDEHQHLLQLLGKRYAWFYR